MISPRDLDRAVETLRDGGLVAFPTETVYGLGADALNEDAVRRVFEAKGRPSTNPLIVHVADVRMAKDVVAEWPDAAERVAQAFWPGPVTIVLPRSPRVPNAVTGGGDTVGVRCPDHEVAIALLERFGSALVGPSANRSGRVSPTTAAHVRAEFEDVMILDGGACRAGIESTVVSLASRPFRVLRPGVIDAAAVAAVVGEIVEGPGEMIATDGPAPSPGLHARHYAPTTRCVLYERWDDVDDRAHTCAMALTAAPGAAHVISMPPDAASYARALYDALRRADALGAEMIAIERPPVEGVDAALWASITDRLIRATAP